MHTSRYNTAIAKDNGEHLLYNSASGAFGVLTGNAWATYLSPDEGNADIVECLADAGFLTNDTPEEELARVREIFDAQRADSSVLDLSIAPTYACNYRCPYCYEQGHNGIPGIMDDKTIDAIVAFVANRYEKDAFGQLAVQWYGGDPTVAYVEDIPRHARFKRGDWVETSGYSSIFPQGVLVGKIEKIYNSTDGLSYRLKVRLSTDFACLRDVYVISDKGVGEQLQLLEAAKDSITMTPKQ